MYIIRTVRTLKMSFPIVLTDGRHYVVLPCTSIPFMTHAVYISPLILYLIHLFCCGTYSLHAKAVLVLCCPTLHFVSIMCNLFHWGDHLYTLGYRTSQLSSAKCQPPFFHERALFCFLILTHPSRVATSTLATFI
jgi:hypothetical protein